MPLRRTFHSPTAIHSLVQPLYACLSSQSTLTATISSLPSPPIYSHTHSLSIHLSTHLPTQLLTHQSIYSPIIYLFPSTCHYLPIHYQFTSPSIHPSISPSTHPVTHVSIYPSIYPSIICPSIYTLTHPSIYLSTYSSVHQFICPSMIYPLIRLS